MYREIRMPRGQATAMDGGRYDCMDAGGRAAPGAAAESNAGSSCRDAQERPGRQLALKGDLQQPRCSPDEAQRNPGIGAATEHFSRIPLRFMRATCFVPCILSLVAAFP
jgi:hypothetical protein